MVMRINWGGLHPRTTATLMESVLLYLLVAVIWQTNGKETCTSQFFLNTLGDARVQTKASTFKDCKQVSFEGSEKLNSHLGSIRLTASIDTDNSYSLNVSFSNIKWRRAYLKLTPEDKPEAAVCKVYSVVPQAPLPIPEAFDPCFNPNQYNTSSSYTLELKAELNTDILYKKVLFSFPPLVNFLNSTPLPVRSIFTCVDVSSNYGIILKIQPLPWFYNVSYYKAEVYRESPNGAVLLDVRMLDLEDQPELTFEYITYNEEGYYFFKVSVISEECAEDACLKSVTPRIHIRRKYPPLVIGIVGASFLIPFVLFVLHMWTRRNQLPDESEEPREKVFMVYNQTPEKHYLIVKSLEKSLKSLTGVQLVPKITEATHIIYICGTHIFEPDPAVHKHIVIEANKAVSPVEILVVSFPYSTKEIPPYLKKCLRFELMADYYKLVRLFNCDAEFENNAHFLDLEAKVKAAEIQTGPKKIILNMPVIIVTQQCDEPEPQEADVLL